MTDSALTIGSFEYDTTRPLFDGSVSVDGVDVTMETAATVPELFERLIRGDEFDVAELGLTFFLRLQEPRPAVRRVADLPEPRVPALERFRQHP